MMTGDVWESIREGILYHWTFNRMCNIPTTNSLVIHFHLHNVGLLYLGQTKFNEVYQKLTGKILFVLINNILLGPRIYTPQVELHKHNVII